MLADDLHGLAPQSSGWYAMDEARVRRFADATEDWQFFHLDAARAAAETPFGGCVAHGFLTLAMLSAMSYEVMDGLDGMGASINYGFDRVRFVSPVPVGKRIRGRFTVSGVDEAPGHLTVHWDVEIEIEDGDKPALVAGWITRLHLEAS